MPEQDQFVATPKPFQVQIFSNNMVLKRAGAPGCASCGARSQTNNSLIFLEVLVPQIQMYHVYDRLCIFRFLYAVLCMGPALSVFCTPQADKLKLRICCNGTVMCVATTQPHAILVDVMVLCIDPSIWLLSWKLDLFINHDANPDLLIFLERRHLSALAV